MKECITHHICDCKAEEIATKNELIRINEKTIAGQTEEIKRLKECVREAKKEFEHYRDFAAKEDHKYHANQWLTKWKDITNE